MTEQTKYEGCRGPFIFPDGERFWLQPPEVTEPCLEEVVKECITTILSANPDARVDREGMFYRKGTSRSGSHCKKRISGTPTVPGLLAQMQDLGYDIPEDYWIHVRERVIKEVA